MPVSRIAISEHRIEQWREAISTALQDALETSFSVPHGDCFQFFDSYHRHTRIFDRRYLCSAQTGRSDDFLLFHITAGKARSLAQKQAFYADLNARLVKAIGINPADVMIVVNFSAPEDWSFGNGKVFSLADISSR